MATLKELAAKHGQLGDRIMSLREPQQREIADTAYECGFIAVLQALETTHAGLEYCMRLAGYERCTGECEAWFPELELQEVPIPVDGGTRLVCEECVAAESDDWTAPEPPPPTTPEEIAAAEQKRQAARDAITRQQERAAERQAAIDDYEAGQS